jgi:8-oxo-dGTP diphosphatase
MHMSDDRQVTQRSYSIYPRIAVGILVFDGNKFLLIRRKQEPNRGKWTIPGGLLELGESLDDAARREIYEECNITVRNVKRLGIFEYMEKDDQNKIKYHYVIIDFIGWYDSGELKAQSDVDRATWFSHADLKHLSCTKGIKGLIRRAISEELFHGEKVAFGYS